MGLAGALAGLAGPPPTVAAVPSAAAALPAMKGGPQEMPATVASDLVERALEDELQAPETWPGPGTPFGGIPPRGTPYSARGEVRGVAGGRLGPEAGRPDPAAGARASEAARNGPPGSLAVAGPWLVTMAVAVLVLALLRSRGGGGPREHALLTGSPAAPRQDDPDVIPIARGRADGDPRRRTRSPQPTETLAIPPHVMEILRRSAERRAAAEGTADTETTADLDGVSPGPDPILRPAEDPARGIDVTLPRYDPRRER